MQGSAVVKLDLTVAAHCQQLSDQVVTSTAYEQR